MLIKAQLVAKIAEIIKQKGITQSQAAALLEMPQPKLSNLLSGRFRGFSERRLMDCLTKLGRDIQIVVKAIPHSRKDGRFVDRLRVTRNDFLAAYSFPWNLACVARA
jgi:predicted XRE-type DNA-binding protein